MPTSLVNQCAAESPDAPRAEDMTRCMALSRWWRPRALSGDRYTSLLIGAADAFERPAVVNMENSSKTTRSSPGQHSPPCSCAADGSRQSWLQYAFPAGRGSRTSTCSRHGLGRRRAGASSAPAGHDWVLAHTASDATHRRSSCWWVFLSPLPRPSLRRRCGLAASPTMARTGQPPSLPGRFWRFWG